MRKLRQIINAQPAQDGDGVNIHRLAGGPLHQALNPFLMIDEIERALTDFQSPQFLNRLTSSRKTGQQKGMSLD